MQINPHTLTESESAIFNPLGTDCYSVVVAFTSEEVSGYNLLFVAATDPIQAALIAGRQQAVVLIRTVQDLDITQVEIEILYVFKGRMDPVLHPGSEEGLDEDAHPMLYDIRKDPAFQN